MSTYTPSAAVMLWPFKTYFWKIPGFLEWFWSKYTRYAWSWWKKIILGPLGALWGPWKIGRWEKLSFFNFLLFKSVFCANYNCVMFIFYFRAPYNMKFQGKVSRGPLRAPQKCNFTRKNMYFFIFFISVQNVIVYLME